MTPAATPSAKPRPRARDIPCGGGAVPAPLVAGHNRSVSGHKMLATGHERFVAGHIFPVAGPKMLVSGHKSLGTGHKRLVSGHKTPVAPPAVRGLKNHGWHGSDGLHGGKTTLSRFILIRVAPCHPWFFRATA